MFWGHRDWRAGGRVESGKLMGEACFEYCNVDCLRAFCALLLGQFATEDGIEDTNILVHLAIYSIYAELGESVNPCFVKIIKYCMRYFARGAHKNLTVCRHEPWWEHTTMRYSSFALELHTLEIKGEGVIFFLTPVSSFTSR